MAEIRNSVFSGLAFAIIFGIFLVVWFDPYYALVTGGISGLAFGTAVYFFVTSKTVRKQAAIGNLNGAPILRSGGANHFVNGEAVGGKLFLLADKLQFQSHGFNIQNHGQIIDLNQIRSVNFCNTLGLVPNGLAVTTVDGKTEKFVVNNRRLWKEEIDKLMIEAK